MHSLHGLDSSIVQLLVLHNNAQTQRLLKMAFYTKLKKELKYQIISKIEPKKTKLKKELKHTP